ncbi:MAG: DinB family protein [Bacillota bacterium]
MASLRWRLRRVARCSPEETTNERRNERIFACGSSGDGSLPSPARVLDFFREANQALLRLAAGDLDRPATSPSRTYQTVGGGLLRMLYHAGYHLGKIMTLRALLGRPRLLG